MEKPVFVFEKSGILSCGYRFVSTVDMESNRVNFLREVGLCVVILHPSLWIPSLLTILKSMTYRKCFQTFGYEAEFIGFIITMTISSILLTC